MDIKILFITPIYPNKINPTLGINVKRIRLLYEEMGFQVNLLAYKSGKNIFQKLYEIIRFLLLIQKEIRSEDYDLINVQYPFLAAIPFKYLNIKKPLLVTLHGTDVKHDSKLRKMLDHFVQHLLVKSDLILVNSEYFEKFIMDKYKLREDKIEICPAAGFNDQYFFYEAASRENYYDYKNNHIRLGYAGRIIKQKGWDIAIDAYLKLVSTDISPYKYTLFIAGNGPEFADLLSISKRINQTIKNADIRVIGSLNSQELGDFYRSLDIFLFPTLFEESLGYVAIESLACGTPVIASSIGAIKEYIVDGTNGYLFDPGDASELTNKMLNYVSLSYDKKKQMRINAAKSAHGFKKGNIKTILNETVVDLLNDDLKISR